MEIDYCLGIGASSKVNNEGSAKNLANALRLQNITFSYIATLKKFEQSIWLSYLTKEFSVPPLFFSAAILAKYQSQLISSSQAVFLATGCHGIAEAAALAALGDKAKLIIPKTICCGFTYSLSTLVKLIDN